MDTFRPSPAVEKTFRPVGKGWNNPSHIPGVRGMPGGWDEDEKTKVRRDGPPDEARDDHGKWTEGGGSGGNVSDRPSGGGGGHAAEDDEPVEATGWKEGESRDVSDKKLASTVPHQPGAVMEVDRADAKGKKLSPLYKLEPDKIGAWTGKPVDLLGIDTNAKTVHGEEHNVKTGILYMTPSKGVGGGVNMCPYASKGCENGCLRIAGRLRMVGNAAIGVAKTKRFIADPHKFVDDLSVAVAHVEKEAKSSSMTPAIRINGTSDSVAVDMLKGTDGKTLPEKFPNVQFYDYTKNPTRMNKFLDGRMPPNYHVTFSRSENNDPKSPTYNERNGNVDEVLKKGGGVAIVFSSRTKHGTPGQKAFRAADPLPKEYRGYPVIDGDKTDLRFGDRTMDEGAPPTGGYWIGLRAKGTEAKQDTTGFVVPDPLKTSDQTKKAEGEGHFAVSNQDPMLVTSWSRLIDEDQFV